MTEQIRNVHVTITEDLNAARVFPNAEIADAVAGFVSESMNVGPAFAEEANHEDDSDRCVVYLDSLDAYLA